MISASRPVINPISVLNPGHGKASIEIIADEPHPGEYNASYELVYRILATPDDGYYADVVQVLKSHEVHQDWDSDSQSVKTTSDRTNVSVYTHDGQGRGLKNSVSTTGAPHGGPRYLGYLCEEELTVYVCFVKEDASQLILITSAGQGGSTSPQGRILDGRPGESVSFPISASPDPGYSFVSWYSHDEVDNVNLGQTTIRGTIPNAGSGLIWATASFRYDGSTPRPPYPPPDPDPDPPPGTKFIVTISASPQAGGVVSGGGEYDSGATCTLSASRNVGFELMRLENAADGITVYPQNQPQCFGKTITHSFAVTKDSSWVAYFRQCTNAILRGHSGTILRGNGGNVLRDW